MKEVEMKRIKAIVISVLLTISSFAVSSAGDLESTLEGLLASASIPPDPIIKQDANGDYHVAFMANGHVTYVKVGASGSSMFDAIGNLSESPAIEELDIQVCADGTVFVLHKPLHDKLRYARIDQDGALLSAGEYGIRGKLLSAVVTPECDLVSWDPRPVADIDTRYNLPVLMDEDNFKIFAIGKGVDFPAVEQPLMHMTDTGHVLMISHRPQNAQKGSLRGVFDHLGIYEFDLGAKGTTDSAIVPLVNNPAVLQSDIPFEGTQVKTDDAGNILIFTTYWDADTVSHLRIVNITQQLEVLQMQGRVELHSRDAIGERAFGPHFRLFWFTHIPFRYGTLACNQLVLTGDTLFYARLYDILSE
jgi:hypothetical protein